MSHIPPCFCDDEGMTSCDWEVVAKIEYHRPGHPDTVISECPWVLKGIPQLLAQAIFRSSVEAVNNSGHEVYKAWLESCLDGADLKAMAQRIL